MKVLITFNRWTLYLNNFFEMVNELGQRDYARQIFLIDQIASWKSCAHLHSLWCIKNFLNLAT